MYQQWFHLSDAPFSISPNPAYLYMSEQHQEALAHLSYAVLHDGGITLLTGEVGTGKTTISRKLLEQLPEHVDIAWVINPKLSVQELLATICDELGIAYDNHQQSIKNFTDLISIHLLQAHADGKHIVLMIDEAQNLAPDVLEQLRLLTNLETNERKLLQIVLIGQPELQEMLERHDLRQLSQRITARFHLTPLNIKETGEYIHHRLSIAGCQQRLFHHRVLRQVHRISGGVPRRINLLCDRALLGAYAEGKQQITNKHIQQAAKETLGQPKQQTLSFVWLAAAFVMLLVALLFWQWPQPHTNDVQAVSKPTSTVQQQSSNPVKVMDVQNTLPMTAYQSPETVEASAPPQSTSVEMPEARDIWMEINQLGSTDFAFQTLAALWAVDLPFTEEPCEELAKHNLQCLRQRSDMAHLRDLNRPAIVRLMTSETDDAMAVVTAISPESVSLQLKDATWQVPLDEFERHWYADFTLLWRSPPKFIHPIRPGNSGEPVRWLATQLDKIQGQMIPPQDFKHMNTILVERLKDFQRQAGLKADGSAGAQTLIRINDAVHMEGPRLSPVQTASMN